MCGKLNSMFEMKVYYVTQVLKQGILKHLNNNYVLTTYPNLEIWNQIYCKSYLGALDK